MKTEAPSHPLAVCAPAVRFPVTICVAAYGSHAPLARRFLASLYSHTNPALFHLRAGLNEVESATDRAFRTYAEHYGNITIFSEPKNIYKSPIMRRMFYEPLLTSDWTLWCDDDAHFTRSDWLQRLSWKIEVSPRVAMWGMKYIAWRREEFILDWIQTAAWYRKAPINPTMDPEGNVAYEFCFPTGGFWAIRTQVLRQLDWPDRRLLQALDDLLLGEALRQNHFEVGQFDYGVNVHDASRRNADAPAVATLEATLPSWASCH